MSLLNSTLLGSLSLQAPTREDVFLEMDVFAQVAKNSPDWELGVLTGSFNGRTDVAVMANGTTVRPDFYHERPEYTPVDIDVRDRKDLRLVYRDQAVKSAPVPQGYIVKVYLRVVEAHEELEELPETERQQAYDRAISDLLRRESGGTTRLSIL